MQPAAASGQPATLASLEADAGRMAASLEKGKYFCLLVLTVIYAAGAMLHARGKPFWYDEVFTVMSAAPPDVAGSLRAAQILDGAPPLTHLLTHFAVSWFGQNEISARLPEIAGFWVFCLSLFWFVRRRLGIFYGLAALLLPLSTQAYDYAYEARPYGVELGFCGLMLLCWQTATESRSWKHAAACAGIAVSLMGALLCHYYAGLLYVPLAGAEAYRSWKGRRLDWGIWIAMFFGAAPLVWRLSTIKAVVHGFSHTSWSEVHPFDVLDFWNDGLQSGLSVLVLALVAMVLWAWKAPEPSATSNQSSHQEPNQSAAMQPWELLAAILFLTIPVFSVAFGLVTHVYSSRYALVGLTGVVLLLPPVVAHMARGRNLVGFLFVALAGVRLIVVTTTFSPPRDLVGEEFVLVDALKQGPVVVADGQLFMQMWLYLPEPLKSNMIFLVDSEASVKYQTFNTAAIDSALSYVRQWFPIRALDYGAFATPGTEFRLLQNPLKPGWMLEKIAADGGSETIDHYTNLRQLYRIRMK
jgi:hypothetical protein